MTTEEEALIKRVLEWMGWTDIHICEDSDCMVNWTGFYLSKDEYRHDLPDIAHDRNEVAKVEEELVKRLGTAYEGRMTTHTSWLKDCPFCSEWYLTKFSIEEYASTECLDRLKVLGAVIDWLEKQELK